MEFDQPTLLKDARTYLQRKASLVNPELRLEGGAELFGSEFYLFSFSVPGWGDFWLVRGPQGYGLYEQTDIPDVSEVILHHYGSHGTDLEAKLAAHFSGKSD